MHGFARRVSALGYHDEGHLRGLFVKTYIISASIRLVALAAFF
jgi:hypothetical protein